MRVAVISDTHGNAQALRAVLAAIDARGPWDQIVMGGDFAFGGPFPAECIALIRERGIPAVRGNTDEAIVEAARGPLPEWSEEEAYAPHDPELLRLDHWALARLSEDQVAYLAELPLRVELGDAGGPQLTVAHATPWSPYPAVQGDAPEPVARRMLDAAGTEALVYGHIHLQYAREVDGRLLVATGSVGLPFDGSPAADYAEFTSNRSGWEVELRAAPYDAGAVIEAARRLELPNVPALLRRLGPGA